MQFYLISCVIAILSTIALFIEINWSDKKLIVIEFALKDTMKTNPARFLFLLFPILNLILAAMMWYLIFSSTDGVRKFFEQAERENNE